MSQATQHPSERSAQLMWSGIILMFFMIQAAIWTYAISITSRDASHAVVVGYDEQALKWDEVKQSWAESEKLGWQAELLVDGVADIQGVRKFTVQLFDAQRQPLENAELNVRAFHRAAASEPQEISFTEIGPGVYSASLNVDRTGKWRFSGTALQSGSQFLFDETLVVSPARKGN